MMKSLKTLKPCFQQYKQSQLLTKLIAYVHLSCELSFDQPRFFGSMFRQHICKAQGTFQKRFSGIRPLRGYPPPTPLTENQSEKKKVFFLSGKGGHPPPFPLRAKSAKTFLKVSLTDYLTRKKKLHVRKIQKYNEYCTFNCTVKSELHFFIVYYCAFVKYFI